MSKMGSQQPQTILGVNDTLTWESLDMLELKFSETTMKMEKGLDYRLYVSSRCDDYSGLKNAFEFP